MSKSPLKVSKCTTKPYEMILIDHFKPKFGLNKELVDKV